MLQVGLPISLAVIMFGMGLGLTVQDFRQVFIEPKAFILGLCLQILALPIIAFTLINALGLGGIFAVGLMILAACPGGTTSNIFTYMARGDVALSVSLTAIISLLGFVTVPFITSFALVYFLGGQAPDFPIEQVLIGIFVIVTVPVLFGMLVRRLNTGLAKRMERFFKPASAVLLALIILVALYVERENIVPFFREAGLITLLFNLTVMGFAMLMALVAKLPSGQQTAITLECGLQNSTLGITIAITVLGNTEMSIPISIYGLIMLGTATIYILRRRHVHRQALVSDGAFGQ